MSFKFRLGDIVVRKPEAQPHDLPEVPGRVVAFQLDGYMQITPVGSSGNWLVHSDDYEQINNEILEFHY
tara:strand:+ start:2044 stop:2250 length:207 start_codon:yes stop_codon:yes gene_type:complete